MANFNNNTRCHPFSSQSFQGRLVCCNKMNLVSALDNTFKCLMCLMRKNTPPGVSPIFPPNHCTNEHIANNHILVCLICQSQIFKALGVKIRLLHTFPFVLFEQPTIHQDHLSVHLVLIHYG